MKLHTDTFHEPTDQEDWNESFYFNAYDREQDICLFMRIGHKPNKKEKMMFCYIMHPDGTFMGVRGEEHLIVRDLRVKGLSYDMEEPEHQWKLLFDGQMQHITKEGPLMAEVFFDLTFEGLHEIFNYRRCVTDEFKERISQVAASEHLEQFGSIRGSVAINGKTYELDALGERDHSWGVRDWNAPKMWVWLTGEFSKETAFNVTKLYVKQGIVDAGFFHEEGTTNPLDMVDIDIRYDDSGAPASFTLGLVDLQGVTRPVEAHIMRHVALPFTSPDGSQKSIMYETLARYEYNGQTGYGIAEFLIKTEE